MYLAAFVLFIGLGRSDISADRFCWTAQQLDDLLFYGVIGVVVGSRLGVLFYPSRATTSHPLEILAT